MQTRYGMATNRVCLRSYRCVAQQGFHPLAAAGKLRTRSFPSDRTVRPKVPYGPSHRTVTFRNRLLRSDHKYRRHLSRSDQKDTHR